MNSDFIYKHGTGLNGTVKDAAGFAGGRDKDVISTFSRVPRRREYAFGAAPDLQNCLLLSGKLAFGAAVMPINVETPILSGRQDTPSPEPNVAETVFASGGFGGEEIEVFGTTETKPIGAVDEAKPKRRIEFGRQLRPDSTNRDRSPIATVPSRPPQIQKTPFVPQQCYALPPEWKGVEKMPVVSEFNKKSSVFGEKEAKPFKGNKLATDETKKTPFVPHQHYDLPPMSKGVEKPPAFSEFNKECGVFGEKEAQPVEKPTPRIPFGRQRPPVAVERGVENTPVVSEFNKNSSVFGEEEAKPFEENQLTTDETKKTPFVPHQHYDLPPMSKGVEKTPLRSDFNEKGRVFGEKEAKSFENPTPRIPFGRQRPPVAMERGVEKTPVPTDFSKRSGVFGEKEAKPIEKPTPPVAFGRQRPPVVVKLEADAVMKRFMEQYNNDGGGYTSDEEEKSTINRGRGEGTAQSRNESTLRGRQTTTWKRPPIHQFHLQPTKYSTHVNKAEQPRRPFGNPHEPVKTEPEDVLDNEKEAEHRDKATDEEIRELLYRIQADRGMANLLKTQFSTQYDDMKKYLRLSKE